MGWILDWLFRCRHVESYDVYSPDFKTKRGELVLRCVRFWWHKGQHDHDEHLD